MISRTPRDFVGKASSLNQPVSDVIPDRALFSEVSNGEKLRSSRPGKYRHQKSTAGTTVKPGFLSVLPSRFKQAHLNSSDVIHFKIKVNAQKKCFKFKAQSSNVNQGCTRPYTFWVPFRVPKSALVQEMTRINRKAPRPCEPSSIKAFLVSRISC